MSRYAPGYTGPMTTAGGVKPAKPKTSTQPPGYTGLSSGPPKTKAPPSKTKAPKPMPMPMPMPKPRVGNMGPGSGGAPMPKPRVMGGSPDKMGGSVKTGMPKMQMGGMVPKPLPATSGVAPANPRVLPVANPGSPTGPKTLPKLGPDGRPLPGQPGIGFINDSGMGPRMRTGGMVPRKEPAFMSGGSKPMKPPLKPKPTGTIVTRFDDSGMGPRPGKPIKPRMKNGGMVKTKKF